MVAYMMTFAHFMQIIVIDEAVNNILGEIHIGRAFFLWVGGYFTGMTVSAYDTAYLCSNLRDPPRSLHFFMMYKMSDMFYLMLLERVVL